MTGPPWFLQGDEPVEYRTTRAPLQASCVDYFAWLPPELVRGQLRGDGIAQLPEPLAGLWCGPACPGPCGARCSVVRDAFACAETPGPSLHVTATRRRDVSA